MGKKIESAQESILARVAEALNKSLAHGSTNEYDNGYAQGMTDALEIVSKFRK
jgi:hypothetical protein